MDIEITWTIEYRTSEDIGWRAYDDDGKADESPTESFAEATGPECNASQNRDIV